jgi:hypothetical protein
VSLEMKSIERIIVTIQVATQTTLSTILTKKLCKGFWMIKTTTTVMELLKNDLRVLPMREWLLTTTTMI